MAGLFESNDRLINSQIWSVDLFKETLDSITSAILERIDIFFQVGNNETNEDTVLLLNSEVLNEEVEEELEQLTVILENKMEALQNEKEEFLGAVGIWEIRNGILQLSYKVLIAVKELSSSEGTVLRKLYCIQQLQKIQDCIRAKEGRGIRVKKRVRKKVRKKEWRRGK